MHRKIDIFTDSHPDTSAAVHLLFKKYRHYSRIAVDIIFDHFLTKNWCKFSNVPIEIFIESVHSSFVSMPSGLPDNFYLFTQRLRTYEILSAYGTIVDLKEVFKRIEMRIKGKSGIDKAWEDLIINYDEFNRLFLSFFPQLINYLSS